MVVIIGGAHQGKTAFAQEHFGLEGEQISRWNGHENGHGNENWDWSRPALADLELFVLELVRRGEDPAVWYRENRPRLEDKLVLCREIGGGVVPVEREMRRWQEAAGRLLQWLCRDAEQVWRLYCGIPQQLK